MDYANLVDIYLRLEKTTKRLEKTAILADFLQTIPAEDLRMVVLLIQGRVFPQYDERKIGFSSKYMLKALAVATGISLAKLETEWNKKGDLGSVAEGFAAKKMQTTLVRHILTVQKVFDNIQKLATIEGDGTVERKVGLVAELLTSAHPAEVRFIVRTILEELRVGTAEGIMRDAIAQAFHHPVDVVEHAYATLTEYAEVAELAKKDELMTAQLIPGKPLRCMLSIVAADLAEAFGDLGKPLQCEFKLDGFRLQIHRKGKTIKLFTRRLEDVTEQFPDVIALIHKYLPQKDFILDTEATGFDPKTGRYIPFQLISQRIKRKYDIEEMAAKQPVEINIFDILYFDGESYLQKTLTERRAFLEKLIRGKKQEVKLTEMLVTSSEKEAQKFFDAALKAGCEGLMFKNLQSVYIPGRYVGGWMKLKKILEPLDLVIVAAEYGSGKRAGYLSSYVLACKYGDQLLECGMVSTGLKEKTDMGVSFSELTELLKPLIIRREGRKVFVKPKIILEVGYEEVQKSPSYGSGYALRFPRFRMIKLDKDLTEINSLTDVERIFFLQQRKHFEKN